MDQGESLQRSNQILDQISEKQKISKKNISKLNSGFFRRVMGLFKKYFIYDINDLNHAMLVMKLFLLAKRARTKNTLHTETQSCLKQFWTLKQSLIAMPVLQVISDLQTNHLTGLYT